jgi:hypothetical protein
MRDNTQRKREWDAQLKDVSFYRFIYPESPPSNSLQRFRIWLTDLTLFLARLPAILIECCLFGRRVPGNLRQRQAFASARSVLLKGTLKKGRSLGKGELQTLYCRECGFCPERVPFMFVNNNYLDVNHDNPKLGLSLCGRCAGDEDMEPPNDLVDEYNAQTHHYRHPHNHYLWKRGDGPDNDPYSWLK